MNRYKTLIIQLLALLLFVGGAAAQRAPSPEELFFEANRAYNDDRFQEAAEGYLKLTEQGFESGPLYYNLGNSYFRLGDLGRTILAYERAYLLTPRDDDLMFNLSYARSQCVDAASDPHNTSLTRFLGLDSINSHETFFGFTLLNGFFFLTFSFRLFKKTEWTYYLSIFLAILLAISACGLALKWYWFATDNRAIVLSEEIELRAGPDQKDTVLFKIHQGAVVQYERSEADWVLLRLSEDKRGWTKSLHIERVVKTT